MPNPMITPVILAGGTGTRLWPMSRKTRPKQMQALTGSETLLQMTALRVTDPETFCEPVVVGGAAEADAIESQLSDVGIRLARLIVEPVGRNTAPAVALAALSTAEETLLLVMPSDHFIRDQGGFVEAVRRAASIADAGWLVTFAINPRAAETGFGYIRRGELLAPGIYRAEQFVEKPNLQRAREFVESGCYDWNAGIFLFRAGSFIAALDSHAPDILQAVRESLAKGRHDKIRVRPEATRFNAVKPRSIDHAVMEHADRLATVPLEVGWSDVGSWDALYDIGSPDSDGNVTSGDVMTIDSSRCHIRSEGPTIVTLGVSDLTVISTPDAVLIVPRGQGQRVREAVELLETRARPK